MISIEVPDTKPVVEVDPSLRSKLTLFSFDSERYVDGLMLAGVPSEAIDSLNLDFNKDALGGIYVDYIDKKHTIKVSVGGDPGIDYETGSPFPTIGHEINFGLAKTARTMADYVLKQSDAVEVGRGSRGSGLLGLLGLERLQRPVQC
jgi:hypothetical protein